MNAKDLRNTNNNLLRRLDRQVNEENYKRELLNNNRFDLNKELKSELKKNMSCFVVNNNSNVFEKLKPKNENSNKLSTKLNLFRSRNNRR